MMPRSFLKFICHSCRFWCSKLHGCGEKKKYPAKSFHPGILYINQQKNYLKTEQFLGIHVWERLKVKIGNKVYDDKYYNKIFKRIPNLDEAMEKICLRIL
ncbi:MAG: hypothetical protein CM15mV63_430 [uncultured marine virus]|nr:MAG: hypothetical protein CM15mV63_430 [uncultured marine virus]